MKELLKGTEIGVIILVLVGLYAVSQQANKLENKLENHEFRLQQISAWTHAAQSNIDLSFELNTQAYKAVTTLKSNINIIAEHIIKKETK